MTQPLSESLEYERFVDGLRKSNKALMQAAQFAIETFEHSGCEKDVCPICDLKAAMALAKEQEPGEELFYIQSKGYIGNSLIWWKKSKAGYTAKLEEALTVGRAEAEAICRNRPDEDIMWPVAVIDAVGSRQVDSQDLASQKGRAA